MTFGKHEGAVREEWLDFNNHMTAASFPTAFAERNDHAIETLGFGAAYRDSTDCALYVVEARYRYRKELRRGDRYCIETALAGIDRKSLTLAHTMTTRAGTPAADAEILFLHVARGGPSVTEFDAETLARLRGAVQATAEKK